jgi:hypothetical protein
MQLDQERIVRRWLESRDPGDPPERLRAAIADVPRAERAARFPFLAGPSTRLPWLHVAIRPALVVLVLLVALLVALLAAMAAGYLILRPPFPPRGLVAYVAPIAASGSTGITLAAADGTMFRQVSPIQANLYDHSPRWSRDGRTLLFARTTSLDPLASCGGVGSVVMYDVATATERVVATHLRPMNVVEWSPGGDRAAYVYPPPGCGAEVELGVVDLRTGAVTTTIVLPQQSEVAPSPGGALWRVQWAGETATAVPEATVTNNGRDFTTTADVPSHDGRTVIRSTATSPERIPKLAAIDRARALQPTSGWAGCPRGRPTTPQSPTSSPADRPGRTRSISSATTSSSPRPDGGHPASSPMCSCPTGRPPISSRRSRGRPTGRPSSGSMRVACTSSMSPPAARRT